MKKSEIIKLLKIELKHLNGHLGECQIQMFENQSGRSKNPGTRKKYDSYKQRIYQTKRIIDLIKEGWKPKKVNEK